MSVLRLAEPFRIELRRGQQRHFEVAETSTGKGYVELPLAGRNYKIYNNANLSVYSAQACNARCPFCVEELRPASRGRSLAKRKTIEHDDERYFAKLGTVLKALAPLDPSVSITGGEPSLDARLPRILDTLRQHSARKLTMTSNGSGLYDERQPRTGQLGAVLSAGLAHLNLSRAHPDEAVNQRLMAIEPMHSNASLRHIIERARDTNVRLRLSCVLLKGWHESLEDCVRYLEWARGLGVDNVVFRQLMHYDAATFQENKVTRFSDRYRANLAPILDDIQSGSGRDSRFEFVRQVLGYYYYVEVYRYDDAVDVVFEGADLKQIEAQKQRDVAGDVVHELIFHPNASLCSSWQPWDGILIP